MADYLLDVASSTDEAPQAFRSVLKYLLLFTLPGLILSFFPFSWIELIFTIWSLIIIYTVGQMLLQWPVVSQQILAEKESSIKKSALPESIWFRSALCCSCYVLY